MFDQQKWWIYWPWKFNVVARGLPGWVSQVSKSDLLAPSGIWSDSKAPTGDSICCCTGDGLRGQSSTLQVPLNCFLCELDGIGQTCPSHCQAPCLGVTHFSSQLDCVVSVLWDPLSDWKASSQLYLPAIVSPAASLAFLLLPDVPISLLLFGC